MASNYEQLVLGAACVYRSDPEAIVSHEDGLAKAYILDLPAAEVACSANCTLRSARRHATNPNSCRTPAELPLI